MWKDILLYPFESINGIRLKREGPSGSEALRALEGVSSLAGTPHGTRLIILGWGGAGVRLNSPVRGQRIRPLGIYFRAPLYLNYSLLPLVLVVRQSKKSHGGIMMIICDREYAVLEKDLQPVLMHHPTRDLKQTSRNEA